MKTCTKCFEAKPLNEFYDNPSGAYKKDSKCKSCAKKMAIEIRNRNLKCPDWILKERERCRNKQRRYRALGLSIQPTLESKKMWVLKNKHKRRAQHAANNALRSGKIKKKSKCDSCGVSGVRLVKHHFDYSLPLDVVWLCDPCHGIAHRKTDLKPLINDLCHAGPKKN